MCLSLLLKQRKNPFNSELNVSQTVTEEKHNQVLDRAVDQTRTLDKGEFYSNINWSCEIHCEMT